MLKILESEKNYRCYPSFTSNKNTPKGVFLIGEYSESGFEYTAYICKDGRIYLIGNESGESPIPINIFKACRITGDTESMIEFRYKQFYGLQ
jgi:hypothetical protein